MEIGDRIKQVLALGNYKTQSEAANDLGLSHSYMSMLLKGQREPSPLLVKLIEAKIGVSAEWLRTGEGNMILPTGVVEEQSIYKVDDKDFVTVPQVRGEISAGGGLEPDNTVEMRVAFRRDWIARHGDASKMSLIRVYGDSMEPSLESGDLVLVDRGRNYVDAAGGIYAVALDNEIMIKRIQVGPEKRIRIISDNEKYETIEADPEDITINGKVVWYGRELER